MELFIEILQYIQYQGEHIEMYYITMENLPKYHIQNWDMTLVFQIPNVRMGVNEPRFTSLEVKRPLGGPNTNPHKV